MDSNTEVSRYVLSNMGRTLNSRELKLMFDLIYVMYKHHTREEILRSFKFNLDFLAKNKLTKINLGKEEKFVVKRVIPTENIHQESVIEYNVLKNKSIISTFGFYFQVDGSKKVTLNISNIQGYVNKTQYNTKDHVLNYSKSNLEKLNLELGENWRVKVVSFLKKYAEKNNYDVVMQLPMNIIRLDYSEYTRQIRQYIQAALKAGLSVNQISTARVNDLVVKEKIISNFEIKKKRNLENTKAISNERKINNKKVEKSVFGFKKINSRKK